MKFKLRYQIVDNFGFIIVDTINDKSVSPRYSSFAFAREMLKSRLERKELIQLKYKEVEFKPKFIKEVA